MAQDTVVIDEVRHSYRGASSAHRWRKCKGSLNLIERLESDGKELRTSGEAAAEGTVAHTVFAAAWEDGSDGADFLGMEFSSGGWTFKVDQEMADGVQLMLDWIRSVVQEYPKAKVHVEKGLQSFTDDDAYGTSDCTIIVPRNKRKKFPGLVIVGDFKYGAGITVEPDSDQNKYYGYLSIENYLKDHKGMDAELFIIQPRIPHPNGLVRSYPTTTSDLVDWWFDELLPDMQGTRDPNAMLVIGDHCRWCPAKRHCPALKQDTMEMTVDVDPSHMTLEEVNEIMVKKKAILAFIEEVSAEAFGRALDGEQIAEHKIVKKMSQRVSKESIVEYDADGEPNTVKFEDAVLDTFGTSAYADPKLRSIAQLEKLEGGPDFVAAWAYMPDNGLTLAANSDKRQAIQRPMDRFITEDMV